MKQLLSFLKKEFLHVFRDRKTLLLLFGLPVAEIVLFGFALTNEVKNSKIVIVDYSKDAASRQLTDRIDASKYFEVEKVLPDQQDIEASFKEGKIKMAIIIPPNFNNDLLHLNHAKIQVIADASDPNTSTTLTSYLTNVVRDYQMQMFPDGKIPMMIIPEVRMLYNPELKGAPNFIPGVIAMVLMLICTMMTSISIVKEKELGTMEILLVSPFKPIYIILSKALPYLILSLFNLVVILVLSVYLLEMPIRGNLFLLFFESGLFILTSLALGLLISTGVKSQQSAMMLTQLIIMLPTLLLTGFMFPIENMPVPLQIISNFIPSRWFFIIIKAVMLKGLGIAAVWKETLILAGMAFALLAISLKNFKIRLS